MPVICITRALKSGCACMCDGQISYSNYLYKYSSKIHKVYIKSGQTAQKSSAMIKHCNVPPKKK